MAKNISMTKYNAIRMLIDSGASMDEITEMMRIAKSTVMAAQKAKNYRDFIDTVNSNTFIAIASQKKKKEQNEQNEQQILQREAEKPSVTLLANHYLMEEIRKQTELLKTISAKLAFIVDELTGKESNK